MNGVLRVGTILGVCSLCLCVVLGVDRAVYVVRSSFHTGMSAMIMTSSLAHSNAKTVSVFVANVLCLLTTVLLHWYFYRHSQFYVRTKTARNYQRLKEVDGECHVSYVYQRDKYGIVLVFFMCSLMNLFIMQNRLDVHVHDSTPDSFYGSALGYTKWKDPGFCHHYYYGNISSSWHGFVGLRNFARTQSMMFRSVVIFACFKMLFFTLIFKHHTDRENMEAKNTRNGEDLPKHVAQWHSYLHFMFMITCGLFSLLQKLSLHSIVILEQTKDSSRRDDTCGSLLGDFIPLPGRDVLVNELIVLVVFGVIYFVFSRLADRRKKKRLAKMDEAVPTACRYSQFLNFVAVFSETIIIACLA